VDLSGQGIFFAYTREGGGLLPRELSWGPGHRFRVVFLYEGRTDEVVSYRTGFAVRTTQRLRELRVESSGETLRSYHISYASPDDHSSLSRISRIESRGRQGQGALPPLSFDYAQPERVAITPLDGTEGWKLGERGVSFSDVDGDGLDDLLRLEMGSHSYKRNFGGFFGEALPLSGASNVDLESSRLLDLDGDSRPELLRIVNDTWRTYGLVGDAWQAKGEWPGTQGVALHGADSTLADLNGDGRTDVLRAATNGLLVSFAGPLGLLAPRRVPRISAGDPTVEPGHANVRFLDVNGDGLADVVWLTDEWMKIFRLPDRISG
jgi:hypothetical protein